MIFNHVYAALLGYLIGMISFGVIFAKIKKVNLRAVGSGNIGGTNTGRALGAKYGIMVILLDASKSLMAALTIRLSLGSEANALVMSTAALFAVIGHCWPAWLNFRGGKGAATVLGFGVVILPLWILIGGIIVAAVLFKLTKIVSVVSLIGGLTLVIGSIWNGELMLGFMQGQGIKHQPLLWIWALVACIILFWRHRSNLYRLFKGQENSLKKKK